MAGRGRMPRHIVREEMHGFREGPPPRGHGPVPPLEEEFAMRRDEIGRLIADNNHLLDENVAMKRELDASREELHVISQAIPKIRVEKETKAREFVQMGLKLEAELRALEPMKAEALELQSQAKKLDSQRQEMSTKIHNMTKDLKCMQAENQQIPKLRMEIEGLREELVRVRAGYDYEQRAHAEQRDQMQAMEKNLVSMAREIEKLRTEHMSMDKRARGPGSGGYGHDMGYPGAFSDSYGRGKGPYGGSSWGPYEPRGFPRP